MSAGIENLDKMIYAGADPWHGLGKKVAEEGSLITAAEAIRLVANYTVERFPNFVSITVPATEDLPFPQEKRVPTGTYSLVRTDEDYVLAPNVSERYQIVQPAETFSFFDNLVEEGAAIYDTVGTLYNGRKLWALARFGEEMVVEHGGKLDVSREYVTLVNGFDGKTPLMAYLTPIRVVCANTLTMSLSRCTNRVKIKHTRTCHEKWAEAHRLMGISTKYYRAVQAACQFLAGKTISMSALADYFKHVLPDDPNVEKSRNAEKRARAMRIFTEEADTFAPTYYSAYNAVAGLIDHTTGENRGDFKADKRLDSIWFGAGASIKDEAFERALVMAGAPKDYDWAENTLGI